MRTQTGGTDLDPDGYTITLDGGSGVPIAVNDSITYASLTAGPHTIQLGNVASNCTVSGANPMTVDAPHGGVTDTAFVVSCAANVGDIQVSNTTTGSNLDASYTVTLDGTTSQTLARNSSVTFGNIAVGSHQITTERHGGQLRPAELQPRTVAVTFNGTAQSSFSVGCVAPLSGKIAFESTRTGPFQVYLMNTDGTGQTQLTNTTTDERLPAISPDGNLIAFQSKRSGAWNIWVMLNDGSSPVSITNDGNAERHPVWSPDGTALAFDKQTTSGQHIYTMNRDGTGLKLITDLNHSRDCEPHWSPDGTKLVFVRDSLGKARSTRSPRAGGIADEPHAGLGSRTTSTLSTRRMGARSCLPATDLDATATFTSSARPAARRRGSRPTRYRTSHPTYFAGWHATSTSPAIGAGPRRSSGMTATASSRSRPTHSLRGTHSGHERHLQGRQRVVSPYGATFQELFRRVRAAGPAEPHGA